jgi:transcriptional regulator GlxA family with amidase domain
MVKIKKATTLLTSKNITMEEVAFKSGFKSYSYFNRCFKKIHKQTPKEYMMSLEN